jgi:hypothetical protein
MTELLTRLWQYDPLLVISGGFILILLLYLEVQRLRIQMINSAFNAFGRSMHPSGGQDEVSGCIVSLLGLLAILVMLVAIYLVALR